MKTFISATVIAVLLIGGIIFYGFVLTEITDEMLSCINNSDIEQFGELWDKHHFIITIGVKYQYIEAIEDTLVAVKSTIKNGSDDLDMYKLTLYNEVKIINDVEKFTIENIL